MVEEFPYFVKITPQELKEHFARVRRWAAAAGRDPEGIRLTMCAPVELRPEAVAPEEGELTLVGTTQQVLETLKAFEEIGVEHAALQFMVPRWPERLEQIERFAREVMPHFKR